MNKEQKQKILDLLEELENNLGDNLGRNGEYLSDQVTKIVEAVDEVPIVWPCCG